MFPTWLHKCTTSYIWSNDRMAFVPRAYSSDKNNIANIGQIINIHTQRDICSLLLIKTHKQFMSRNQIHLVAGARTTLSKRSTKQMNKRTHTHTLISICVCLCTHKQTHSLKSDWWIHVWCGGKYLAASPCHHMGERREKKRKKRCWGKEERK